MVASEAAPWAKTGGLADVLSGLPLALEALGHRVTVVIPWYRGVIAPPGEVRTRRIRFGASELDVSFHTAPLSAKRRLVLVGFDPYFDRAGYYGTADGDFPDNAARFALLCETALDFAERDDWPADVVHTHDWQAGLAPAWLAVAPDRWPRTARAARVQTIHNLAYQGLFPPETVPALGLPWSVFGIDGGEFYGRFSFLKAGINYSDYVTTVSRRYAEETRTREFGSGFEGILAARGSRYVGILNGIDADAWNPSADPHLPAPFDADSLEGKSVCKRALLERFNLPVGDDALDRPLVGMVSRLVDQKGLDLVQAASAELLGLDATWVFVGSGESRYETWLRDLAGRHPTRVGTFIGFDEALAHLVEAGADLFLMPSRFEPCGLNQLYSLRYGTVPVVHAVGGLDDTVRPYTSRSRRANGFKFLEPTADALVRVMKQALRLYRDRRVWTRLQAQGMSEDHSWRRSAREYVKVYRRARLEAAARRPA